MDLVWADVAIGDRVELIALAEIRFPGAEAAKLLRAMSRGTVVGRGTADRTWEVRFDSDSKTYLTSGRELRKLDAVEMLAELADPATPAVPCVKTAKGRLP